MSAESAGTGGSRVRKLFCTVVVTTAALVGVAQPASADVDIHDVSLVVMPGRQDGTRPSIISVSTSPGGACDRLNGLYKYTGPLPAALERVAIPDLAGSLTWDEPARTAYLVTPYLPNFPAGFPAPPREGHHFALGVECVRDGEVRGYACARFEVTPGPPAVEVPRRASVFTTDPATSSHIAVHDCDPLRDLVFPAQLEAIWLLVSMASPARPDPFEQGSTPLPEGATARPSERTPSTAPQSPELPAPTTPPTCLASC